MARCVRCNACESMWDCSPCKHCAYPNDDIRTLEQVVEDDKDYDEWLAEQGIEPTPAKSEDKNE